jgi:TonB family protein
MDEQWNQCEGQIVDGNYPLRRLLGGTADSAVFLTEISGPEPKDAAIKFIPADRPTADARLAFWRRAIHLSHPNLLTVYDAGSCRLGDQDNIYVVMEYAEENLSEILPQRALSAEEVQDLLNPVLDVLVYLSSKGLAHGHLKPSNILATQNCVKLSSDAVQTVGAEMELHRLRDIYDAPETSSGPVNAKCDVWALGIMLVEAFTQHTPPLSAGPLEDPAVPASLPPLYNEIASHALRGNPKQRWSVAQIAARVNPAPLAAAAVAGSSAAQPAVAVSPVNVPLSPEPAVPLAKMKPAPMPVRPREASSRPQTDTPLLDRLLPIALGAAVLLGLVFALPKILNFREQPRSRTAVSAVEPSTPRGSSTPQGSESLAASVEPPPAKSTPNATDEPPSERPVESALSASPAVLRTNPDALSGGKTARDVEGHSQVLDQVLPQVSPKALATIQGTVRVVVKVDVDAAGNVTDSNLETPGPSKYFAGLAEKAARQWKFSGAEQDGHGVPSAWLLRFEFSQSGVHASSEQSTH